MVQKPNRTTLTDSSEMYALLYTFRRWQKNKEITQILLDAGAATDIEDSKGYTLFDHAMIAALELEVLRSNDPSGYPARITTYQFPINESYSRFVRAAKDGDYDSLKSQMRKQLPSRIINLALHETLSLWKLECCQLLLDNGADPDAIGLEDYSPLAVAATELEIEIAGLLHSYGASLELANCSGQRPLFLACQAESICVTENAQEDKRVKMASLLLGRGADVEGADNDGWTPLRQAVLAVNDIDLVRLLLQHGARPDRKNTSGVTPLQLAEQHCSSEMVALLREAIKLKTVENGETL